MAVVLHQGEQPWPVAAHFRDLLEGTRERESDPLDATSVDFRFIIDDLAACSDAQLRGRALDAVASLALLLVLRDRSLVKDVREPELFTEARLPMVAPEVRAMGMTAADRWIEQGRQEGQLDAQRAVRRRLLAKRFGVLAPDIGQRIAAAVVVSAVRAARAASSAAPASGRRRRA